MTRLQKTAAIIALAVCFFAAVGSELRDASHAPQSPSQSTAAKYSNSPSYRAPKENPEEAIARYNGWLTIFTGILAGFTAVLAIATVALGAMNFFQLKLARAEFASSHRPKIRIKHVWLVTLGSNQPVTVDIVYTNVGDAKAVISSIGMDFNVINPDAQLPPDMTPPGRPYISYPECGLGVTIRTGNILSLGRLNDERVQAIRNGTKLLCCFGFVEYFDAGPKETRKIRRSAFCRVYKPSARPIDGMGRFVKSYYSDPDYEYED